LKGSGTTTLVGVFTLGLALGALGAPWLPGWGKSDEARRLAILIEELEAEVGADRIKAAVARVDERMEAAGLY
jgi:hypothetical protein